MTIKIEKDSYLIIVYKDFDNILISDFPEKKKENSTNILNKISNQSKTSTGQKLLKVVNMGITSSIAQNMASKTGLPNSVQGRIQSSLYDIMADGKISKLEVAKDFIGSCANELDSTAISMGLPTSQALYSALAPDGSGVIAKDFVKHFQKKAEEKTGEKLAQRNKVAQDTNVLKFKLVTADSESWNSNLPTRKTEKGFSLVDAIENENKTRDFSISIIQGDYSGITDMYSVKTLLETIWNNKKPFDIYVNDANNNKTETLTHCAINSISWESEGVNCLNASLNITKIPEWEVKVETVSGGNGKAKAKAKTRKKGKVRSSKKAYNKVQSTKKSSNVKANAGTVGWYKGWVKNQIEREKNPNFKQAHIYTIKTKTGVKINNAVVTQALRANGMHGTPAQYGIK